jgi:hypothetical protein
VLTKRLAIKYIKAGLFVEIRNLLLLDQNREYELLDSICKLLHTIQLHFPSLFPQAYAEFLERAALNCLWRLAVAHKRLAFELVLLLVLPYSLHHSIFMAALQIFAYAPVTNSCPAEFTGPIESWNKYMKNKPLALFKDQNVQSNIEWALSLIKRYAPIT